MDPRQKLSTVRSPRAAQASCSNRRPPVLITTTCLLAALAAGCADTRSEDGFDPTDHHVSESGAYLLTAERNPDPPRVGVNSIALDLLDVDGNAMAGVDVRIEPWMPAHGHGTTIVHPEKVEAGRYATEDLYFNMPGSWQIRILIDGPDGEDRTVIDYEVQ